MLLNVNAEMHFLFAHSCWLGVLLGKTKLLATQSPYFQENEAFCEHCLGLK